MLIHMVGYIIGIVLRYEYTRSTGILKLPTAQSISLAESSPVLDTHPSADSDSDLAPTSKTFSIDILRKSPSFSAPLFHVALATLFIVHIPALYLVIPRHRYLLSSPSVPEWIRTVLVFVAEMPPQLLAIVIVPAVIAIATRVRGDGNELWNYSEHWVLVHKKESARVDNAENAI